MMCGDVVEELLGGFHCGLRAFVLLGCDGTERCGEGWVDRAAEEQEGAHNLLDEFDLFG